MTIAQDHLMTPCDVCGRRVFVLWFALYGDKFKCGQCSTPKRADVQRVFPCHDAGDEDRTEGP